VLVRAPAGGRVLRVPERSERVVAAGTPIMEIGDALQLEIVADVLSSEAVRLREGDPVEIVAWGGAGSLTGCVRSIEPAAFTRVSALGVDEQRVNVLIDVTNPPAALGHAYKVEVRIMVWDSASVLVVPVSALSQRAGAQWEVFVVSEGRARRRAVEVGHRAGADAQIVRGLEPGEEIILFASDKVEEGVRVRRR
jgi:HlyD family secretion protein